MILPQFPLRLVVFPNETLALHIFEPRYQTLIKECVLNETSFGNLPYIGQELASFGTEVIVDEVVTEYENGTMDIRCKGQRIYEVHEYTNVERDKGYSFAEVKFLPSEEEADGSHNFRLFEKVNELTELLGDRYELSLDPDHIHSSQFIHKLGLDAQTELDILLLRDETKRQLRLIQIIELIIEQLTKAEEIKRRIQLNGHFKKLDPLDL